jgi:hypothetical protein
MPVIIVMMMLELLNTVTKACQLILITDLVYDIIRTDGNDLIDFG